MKNLLLIIPALMFSGCAVFKQPVPQVEITATAPDGSKLTIKDPMNHSLAKVTVTKDSTNGFTFNLEGLNATNDSNVVGTAYAGQAASITAAGAQINQAMVNGAQLGATIAAQAAKAAVKP